ncbi:hypothetical protein BH23PSE2_BH23PSE2_14270 [soil metagenome]
MSLRIAIVASLLALATTGCNRPPEPPTDAPPAPQATRLHDAIQAPIDKARAVEGTVQDAADRQRAEIDAAGG